MNAQASTPLNDRAKVGLNAVMDFTVVGGNATVQEVVSYTAATGCLAGLGSSHGDHSILIVNGQGGDEHGTPLEILFPGGICSQNGKRVAEQYWRYKDGPASFQTIPGSGFKIKRVVTRISDNQCILVTTKKGAAVSISGTNVTAGGGSVTTTHTITRNENGTYTIT